MPSDLPLPQRPDSPDASLAASADSILERVDGPAEAEGIYVHVPFCSHRCHYCDFFTVVGHDDQRTRFVDRLIDEIAAVPRWIQDRPRTIFVGGGTPTHLPPDDLRRLLAALRDRFGHHDTLEFSVEANPETVTPEIAAILVEGGVNRVSLGAQSFDHRLLDALERHHDPERMAQVMGWLREAGVTDLSLDLIFAIPDQTMEGWIRDLRRALELEPTHLSCYGLIFEPGTPLNRRLERGEVLQIDEDLEADMYEYTCDHLDAQGWRQYEISNWCRPGQACQHNLLYWRTRNWWPLGPSASGHVDGWRWRNAPRLSAYLAGTGLSPVWNIEHLSDDGRIGEWFMMGLRCNEGLGRAEVEQRLEGAGGARRRVALERHHRAGLVHWRDERLALTPRGRLLANLVTADLLATPEEIPS